MKRNILILSVSFFFGASLTSLDGSNGSLNNYEVENLITRSIKLAEMEKIRVTNLIEAIIVVESQGNDKAVGDTHMSEQSIGALQIRPIMVREVNRILKLKGEEDRFHLKDRYDRDKSIQMFMIWKDFYHDDSDDETIARSWNGGPKGNKNPKTLRYWEKVEEVLTSL